MKKRTSAAVLIGGVAIALAAASPALAAGTWTVVSPQQPAGSTGDGLNAVYTASPTEAFAVGYNRPSPDSNGFNALIEEWNGSAWSVVQGANVGPVTATTRLYGVSGSGPDDVWAVGDGVSTSQIQHWNGTSWSLVPSPANEPQSTQLYDVSADSPTDAWAGGLGSNGSVFGPVIEHWNGTSWTVVPNAAPSRNEICAIDAISPTDVWAAAVPYTGRDRTGTMEHWNGTQWSVVTMPTTGIIDGISGASANDVWAVGQDGMTDQWNGTQWTQVTNPDGGTNLAAVDALSADDVWAISNGGAVTMQWNGTQWNSVPPAASIPGGFTAGTLSIDTGGALSGVAGGPMFAVGETGNTDLVTLEQPQP
jgi:hypothetical protein